MPSGYELLGELGRGGVTVTYRVRRAGVVYAMKVLPQGTGPAVSEQAFRREAALLACVDHPGVARVHEVGTAAGRPYLVMDLVEGRPLAKVLADGPLPPGRVSALGRDVAAALGAAHHAGLVHRDVKPDNIIVGVDGPARVIDFGLAARPGQTDENAVAGTLLYCSPEQAGLLNRPVDARSDLYALGAVLFQSATGTPPFVAEDVGELLRMLAGRPAPDPRSVRPDLPAALSGIILKLLAKDPDDRYQSCAGLLVDLRRATEDPGLAGFVLGAADEPVGAKADHRLVGRDRELSVLTGRWASARHGAGGVATIEGPPGSGKSRLLRELATVVAASGGLVLSAGRSLSGGLTAPAGITPPGGGARDGRGPLGPLRAVIEEHVRQVRSLPDADVAVAARVLASAAGRDAPLLARVSPALGDLLGIAPPAPTPLDTRAPGGPAQGPAPVPVLAPALAPVGDEMYEHLAGAVAGFLAAVARAAGGAVLLLDDAQWLDRATRRVLEHLLVALPGTPLLVVATARDDTEGTAAMASLRSLPGTMLDVALRLEPLGPADIARLIASATGGMRIEDEVAASLTARSQGNPFTALEYLNAIVDAGLARPSWGRWLIDSDRLQDVELTLDAVELVLGRLEGLDAEGRFLLGVGAVLGGTFAPEFIADVCRIHPWRARKAAEAAADRQLLERLGDGRFRFLFEPVREALLAQFGDAELRAAHERIADVLEAANPRDPESVRAFAVHCRLGEAGRNPARVWRACAAAGRLALTEGASTEALELFEEAARAAAAAGIEPGPAFLRDLGDAQHRAGRCDDAVASLRRAYAGAGGRFERAAILVLLSQVHGTTWDTAEQAAAAERALSELGRRQPRGGPLLLLSTLWIVIAGALVGLTRLGYGTARGRRRERLRLVAAARGAAVQAYARDQRPALCLFLTLRGRYAARRLGPGPETARMHMSGAHVARLLRLDRAALRAEARAGKEAARAAAAGDPRPAADVASLRALDRYAFGLDQGESLRQVIDEHADRLDAGRAGEIMVTLLWDALLRGDLAEAERVSARHQALAAAGGQGGRIASPAAEAAVLALRGDGPEAMARLDTIRKAHGVPLPWEQVDLLFAAMLSDIESADAAVRFDDTAAEFDGLRLGPRALLPGQRGIYIALAYGRLQQCRAAGMDDGPRRMRDARDAMERLRRLRRLPLFAVHHQVIRAALLELSGEPDEALRVLNKAEPLLRTVNAPRVAYEAARVRAYALRSLGVAGEAQRQARYALAVAVDQRWPHRARWLADGFALDAPVGVAPAPGGRLGFSDAVTLDRYRQRLHAVQQVGAAGSRVLDPVKLATVALDEIIRILGAERAFLFLIDEDTGRLMPYGGRDAAGGTLSELTGYSSTLVDRVRHGQEPLIVTGSEEGAVLGARSVIVHGLRSIMVAPLRLDGRLLGVVYLDSRVARGIFTEDDVGVLVAITSHVAIALQTAKAAQLEVAVAAANRRRDLADAMRSALAHIGGTLQPEEVLARLRTSAVDLTGADRSWLLLAVPGEHKVRLVGGENPPWNDSPLFDPDPLLSELLDAVAPVAGRMEAADTAWIQRPAFFDEMFDPARCWAAIPLTVRGERLGSLLLAARRPDAYDSGQPEVAAALAGQAMIAYENALLFAQVQRLATLDGLTGVANRRHFVTLAGRELALARRHSRPLAAMMIDIDHFKSVNDRFGHQAGDEVIQAVASRLCLHGREENLVGRYGGEEFAIVLPAGEENPVALAERLRRAVADEPVVTAAGPVTVTVSIGVTRLQDSDRDLSALLARADRLLYQAKRSGRDRVEVD